MNSGSVSSTGASFISWKVNKDFISIAFIALIILVGIIWDTKEV